MGSFLSHNVDDVDRKELASLAEESEFTSISFSTTYEIEEEINGNRETQLSPIFLMVAQRN